MEEVIALQDVEFRRASRSTCSLLRSSPTQTLEHPVFWTQKLAARATRAVSTDILHFRTRVLGVYGQGLFMGSL